jgi:GAF domain-containing protein
VGERPQNLDVLMHSPVSTASADQLIEELKQELKEAHRRETATAEILRIISSSPTNMRAVLDMVAASAVRLCDAHDATIHQVDGELLRLVAHHGPILTGPTMPLARGALVGRAVLERQAIQIADLSAEKTEYPEGSESARRLGFRTTLAVPLIRAGNAVGVISIRRTEVRPFADRQIELLKTFANQAVIAIENARLLNELRESLQQQTATADVLNVISRSPTDVQPVFDAIARSATELCGAENCNVFRFDGELVDFAASYGTSPEAREEIRKHCPVRRTRGFAAARAVLSNAVEEIPDIYADAEYAYADIAKMGKMRSAVAVPMGKDGQPVGAIAVVRSQPGRFPERQVELLETFADQAVIAIENTRLFEEVQARTKELQESLDRQTATGEVLGAISRSPNEVQPVFDTIMATARRLCQAERAIVWRLKGETFRVVTHLGLPAERVEAALQQRLPVGRGSVVGRAAIARRAIQVEDVIADPDLAAQRDYNRAGNTHTVLAPRSASSH